MTSEVERHFVCLFIIELWKQFISEMFPNSKRCELTACSELIARRFLCLIVSNIYSSLAVIESLRSEREEKKVHKRVSLIWKWFYPFLSLRFKPQRMEQLKCGPWGFHMRTPHIFINFPSESIRVAPLRRGGFSLETIKECRPNNIFPSPNRPFDNKRSRLTWLIGWAWK